MIQLVSAPVPSIQQPPGPSGPMAIDVPDFDVLIPFLL